MVPDVSFAYVGGEFLDVPGELVAECDLAVGEWGQGA